MEKPEAIVLSAKGRDSLTDAQRALIDGIASVTYVANLTPMQDDELIRLCRTAKYIGITRRTCTNFHAQIIEKLKNLKGLSIYATGTEWIDVKALKRANVQLKYLQYYSTQSVAEHAIAMLLAFSRRIHLSDRIGRNDIPRSTSIRGWELCGKTIGIIGMGRIGWRVSQLASAFGMTIKYYDPRSQLFNAYESQSFDDLVAHSDILMLTASVDRDNPLIITKDSIDQMKSGVYIVNPSRPELVDNGAILQAIEHKKVAGYAVDDFVFSAEELKSIEYGRILQTGHSGWYSNEAIDRGLEMWINNLVELIVNEQHLQ